MSLNPAQQAAVDYRGGPLLVLAGAGTGKTRVITHRVAALLDEDVPPWQILAVTFTNKAAGEMRDRIDDLCAGRHDTSQLWVGTFHSICARILRRHGEALGFSQRFSIYDPGDQQTVMRRVLEELNVSDKLYSPRGILGHIDRAKNRGLGPDELEDIGLIEPVRSVVRKAYANYQDRLRAADAVDFGDLLMHVVELLKTSLSAARGQLGDTDPVYRFAHRFRYIVVDEFQDTNPVQADLVDFLGQRAELCVVGDDDQAIYGWRGADVDQFLRFPDLHEGAEVVKLEQNYRSTTNILACADAVISKNFARMGKTLWSELGEGEPVRVLKLETERDEARFIAQEIQNAIDEGADPEDMAIFYRTHAQSRVIEDEIRRQGLSCRLIGGVAFYERLEVKDVLSYLALIDNPNSDAHLIRIINRPTRGIGKTSQQRLIQHAAARGLSLWGALPEAAAAGLGKAACRRVAGLIEMMKELQDEALTLQLDELLAVIVDKTGYREMLLADDSDEAVTRLENLQELHGNAMEFVQERPDGGLPDYLELVSLVGGERSEGDRGRAITLMTVHSAKGLEYEHVYLTGMEERVFPHARVLEDDRQLEEERRLAYVALTRAKRRLTVSMAARRRIYGQVQVGIPSRFAGDLPRGAITIVGEERRRTQPTRASPARASAGWNDDIEYDDVPPDEDFGVEDQTEDVPLYVGMLVQHAKFGRGEVLGWSGAGAKLKLHLRFGTNIKTIMARFCEPL